MELKTKALSGEAFLEARRRWDSVAKPLGSLGLFEEMLSRIAAIQGSAGISVSPRCVLVFCADHGVVRRGVTQTGSEVTVSVADAVAEGASTVNLMAGRARADVFAVDMGMLRPGRSRCIINKRLGAGTGDLSSGPAMTRAQAERGIRAGMDLVKEMRDRGYKIIAAGEMGIGNTTALSALACCLLNAAPEEFTGRGAGLPDEGLARKIKTVGDALKINHADPADPVGALAALGGFEIAGMAGAFLGGAVYGVPVVVDGAISAVAALVAARVCPDSKAFMLASHMSREPAGKAVIKELGLRPVLHAGMALGEGTGAAMLFPLLDMALEVYSGGHTFASLGMRPYEHFESNGGGQ